MHGDFFLNFFIPYIQFPLFVLSETAEKLDFFKLCLLEYFSLSVSWALTFNLHECFF